jgi:hypothetical protein
MYFDEGRVLNHSQCRNTKPGLAAHPPRKHSLDARTVHTKEVSSGIEWNSAQVLDSANNKLQELMQILYLLSRDPAVPKDARYHVTVAQGEIALLANLMRNTAESASAQKDETEAGAVAAETR